MLPVSRKSATVANSPHIHTLFLSSLPSCSCSSCFGPTGWLLIEHPLKTCSVEAWQDGCATLHCWNLSEAASGEGCGWLPVTAILPPSPYLHTYFSVDWQKTWTGSKTDVKALTQIQKGRKKYHAGSRCSGQDRVLQKDVLVQWSNSIHSHCSRTLSLSLSVRHGRFAAWWWLACCI